MEYFSITVRRTAPPKLLKARYQKCRQDTFSVFNSSSSTAPNSSALFQCVIDPIGNTSEIEMLLAAKLSYYFLMKIYHESKCIGGAQP
jgi:hypothetical protein